MLHVCFEVQGHWTETVQAAEPLTGPSMTRYRNLAKVWANMILFVAGTYEYPCCTYKYFECFYRFINER